MWLRQDFRFGRQGFNKGMREHDRTGCEQRLYCRGLHSRGRSAGLVLSQEFRKKIMNVFSCITLGIGVTMLSKGDSLPPVVLSCCSERRSAS